MSVSVDDDLARATSQSLSMGSSVVSSLQTAACVLPRKLHPALYCNTLGDVAMSQSGNVHVSGGGVPGFPDFPDCWQAESSADRSPVRDASMGKKHCRKWKANAAAKRKQRRLVRKAVNSVPAAGAGKEIKRKLKEERRLRRNGKVKQLQERRRRKREMGNICQGLASMKC